MTGSDIRAIDWGAVHRRLAATEQALTRQFAPSSERQRSILRARARALAARPPEPPGESLQVLGFVVAQERYEIASAWVREVVPLRDLTPLPGLPEFVRGVVHLRGQIVSVLELKRFFDLPDPGLPDLSTMIILSDGAMQFAILADRVLGIHSLPRAEIQPPLPTLTGIRGKYLIGIGVRGEVVLDGGKLLGDPAIVVAEEAAG